MQMVLGVMEGQIRGGYFPDYIFDPSVVDCNEQLHHRVPPYMYRQTTVVVEVFGGICGTPQ